MDTLAGLGDLGQDAKCWPVKVLFVLTAGDSHGQTETLNGKGLMNVVLVVTSVRSGCRRQWLTALQELVLLFDDYNKNMLHNFPSNSMIGWFYIEDGCVLC